MNAYCERASLSMATVRFRFDGQAINELDTPETLEMEEGDTIEVYQQQTGGFNKLLLLSNSLNNLNVSDKNILKHFPNKRKNSNFLLTLIV